MAKIDPLIPIVFNVEGGYVNNKNDHGGATNMGVTLATWKSQGYDKNSDGIINEVDIKLLTRDDVVSILRIYWNQWKADEINNQSIANLLVDFVWASGIWGIKIPQLALGVTADGKVGRKTIDAVNNGNQSELFSKLWNARKLFFDHIVERDHTQMQFYNGWINRLSKFKFKE